MQKIIIEIQEKIILQLPEFCTTRGDNNCNNLDDLHEDDVNTAGKDMKNTIVYIVKRKFKKNDNLSSLQKIMFEMKEKKTTFPTFTVCMTKGHNKQ